MNPATMANMLLLKIAAAGFIAVCALILFVMLGHEPVSHPVDTPKQQADEVPEEFPSRYSLFWRFR